MLKYDKSKALIAISLISIFLVILLAMQESTISDLSFNESKIKNLYGYDEPSGGITYIEALGLEYISLGSIFNYGVTKETVLYFFENLMNQDLVEENSDMLKTIQETSLKEIDTSKEGYLYLENVANIEYTDYVNSQGEKIKDNQIMTVTIPKNLSKDNVETTSNAWKFDYHLYDDSFIGVDEAIWYSQLFDDSLYFDRAWTSLKWLCQEKIQCEILNDMEDYFEVLVYGTDGYCWLVSFIRNNGDIFNYNKNLNYISMSSMPITEEDSFELLNKYGIVDKLETN